eukprot:TRINITY_DN5439_c0_g1_i1.p1 TRINITY_DN5439_c0_g1~~TRINITY_DN5439_c0_g1_i1.p1  ORF type:complete len:567 (-),score=119.35 TRINITY_DN5439_c0_g1_i1:65-1714(-)
MDENEITTDEQQESYQEQQQQQGQESDDTLKEDKPKVDESRMTSEIKEKEKKNEKTIVSTKDRKEAKTSKSLKSQLDNKSEVDTRKLFNVSIQALSSDVNESDLTKAFESCGPLFSVSINQDRNGNMGFVNFLSEEARLNALAKTFEIQGKSYKCQVTDSRSTLYVGNLPSRITQEELKHELEAMAGYSIDSVVMKRGFAFVNYPNYLVAERVVAALKHKSLRGLTLNIQLAFCKDKDLKDDTLTTLYVRNLSSSVTDSSFRERFSRYGTVVKAQVILDVMTGTPRNYGFVEFSNSKEARTALTATDGMELEGKVIHVEVSKPMPTAVRSRGRDRSSYSSPSSHSSSSSDRVPSERSDRYSSSHSSRDSYHSSSSRDYRPSFFSSDAPSFLPSLPFLPYRGLSNLPITVPISMAWDEKRNQYVLLTPQQQQQFQPADSYYSGSRSSRDRFSSHSSDTSRHPRSRHSSRSRSRSRSPVSVSASSSSSSSLSSSSSSSSSSRRRSRSRSRSRPPSHSRPHSSSRKDTRSSSLTVAPSRPPYPSATSSRSFY